MQLGQLSTCPGEDAYREGLKYLLLTQFIKSLPYFKESAKQGYPAAYLYLQSLYCKDLIPCEINEAPHWNDKVTETFQWFEDQAQQKGDSDSIYNLGYCYLNGVGTSINEQKGFSYYCKAAEQGYVLAQSALGVCYEFGLGVVSDFTKAFMYYSISAEQGVVYSQYRLGYCYGRGLGIEQNSCLQVKYYKLAADQGYSNSQLEVGDFYRYGQHGVKVDLSEAIRYYILAAEQKNGGAVCCMSSKIQEVLL